ncbi:hypothetical protein BP6252_08125 [Coleophoma cylindrospora]|uniref:P-loop containing nucleoside triphosphate hydrolase protein n=1 Tax=Coleophoma cylindrospora TaxID=1849047 RepID=A0A3D8RBZ6_9HELO|nr:hypothetical protein BP6252_08125 [Coleophoma cylindrospora]
MAEGSPEQEPVRGAQSISAWYDSSRPIWIDLVGDYAGKELFLIEGDSLLRECFEDERIDFNGTPALLPLIFTCQSHRLNYDRFPALCTNTIQMDSNSCTQCSDAFKEYLHVSPIHFVMAHDGAAKYNTDDTSEIAKCSRNWLRGIIWHFNIHELNVALINRIEFRDSKVFTMIMESFTLPSPLKLQMTSDFTEEIKAAQALMADFVVSQAGQQPSELLKAAKLEPLESNEEMNLGPYLVAHAMAKLLDVQTNTFLASAFMLHSLVLEKVSLPQRRLPLITFDEKFEEEIDDFFAKFSGAARSIIDSSEWRELLENRDDEGEEADTVDLVDGRLFRATLQAFADGKLTAASTEPFQADWTTATRIIKSTGSGSNLSFVDLHTPKSSQANAGDAHISEDANNLAVLPFTSPVFDKHLECINVETDNSVAARLGSMRIYRETTHWHNHRKPLNPKLAPVVKVSKWKNPLRLNQFYMSEMTSYAASLTGAKGKTLEPETITVGPKQLVKIAEKSSKPEKPAKPEKKSKKEELQEAKGPAKKGTKKAAAGLSKKEQMIADNKERKGSSEADKVFSAWAMVMKGLDAVSDYQDRYLRTTSYLNNLDSTKASYLESEVNTYILQSLLSWWADYCKASKKAEGYHVVALIWTTIRSLCTTKSPITKEIILHMTKVASLLGITDALSPIEPSGSDRKLSFVFKYPVSAQPLRIDMPQVNFQLDYCGPYMPRMLDAKPDPRVTSFVPDGWQREVLDDLDANRSVFVVAPTSAGKTFISFYAMESILRADNDGVLIYVAPTKALVNQIAAEVQGRFSKKFPQPGKGVWAIHTRDYRVNNSTGCQILVTVPHILQIMLLSPSNAKSWAPRVRRIIFDEIHSIGQAEDGVVWEQLLLLAPCPIIALSATVGNPESFNDWLTETQKASGHEMKMIQHSTRYSDLRKYMYEPPKTFQFSGFGRSYGGGLGLDGLEGFEPFHPISSLIDKSRGMPDDLALEPRDCFSLWKAMCKVQNEKYKVPVSLDPAKALPACIRKADIFAWEKGLKTVLKEWMGDSESPFDQIVSELSPLETAGKEATNGNSEPLSSQSSSVDNDVVDPLDLKSTTLPLLFQLHRRRALPAILFNYDRSECENVARSVLKQLVDAENKWKEGREWKKLMDGFEKYLEQKNKKSRKPVKPSKKGNDDEDGGSKMDRMRDDAAADGVSIYDNFDPNAPQADFSFANPKHLPKAELDDYIKQLRRKYIAEDLIDLLRRGIGVHHAGMNRKYRQSVEMLFRKGFLRVVIATGTLSLGINMPCATVVFSGDSVYLTALNFRQAAGRSGRRGFDLLGNVVFQGIPRERASRLLSSRLPELTGHFPITTTLVLRLCTLLNDSKSSPYAVKAINSLLSQPRLYLGGKSFKEQVLHHLRFSIEYLRRNQLLGPRGEPVEFTSIVSHLYFTENSSFAFHALLRGGYFHSLCADIETKGDEITQTLILVLSHLFARRVVREIKDEEEIEKIKRSPSLVYLPDMPTEAVEILRKHNADTLDIFTTYVKTFAAQHVEGEESQLPFTKTPIGADAMSSTNGKAANGTVQPVDFLPTLSAPHARSAFVALSGHGDDFKTIEDLCSSTREGVFLESAVIPHLEIHPDETRSPLNAYLLDFFMHGSVKPLEEANGIRASDVWFALNDFSMVLATICTSLAIYLGLGSTEDPEMLDVMGSGDAAENDADEQIAATDTETTISSASVAPSAPPTLIKKGKKGIVDDWDAGEDALVAEEDFLKNEMVEEGRGETDDEEYEKLMNVYRAFRKLKTEFDEKFRAIWA